ncbi:MAG: sulfate ABC transporter substrate-binding protein [Verrucomicrobia bacterium]|nr:sulfate ABC transporter substrate-binding protein [Verrucomicrobiota bacterium]
MKRFPLLLSILGLAATVASAQTEILNASYDISRELFAEVNAAFIPAYKASGGGELTIKQSHGGSSRQARAILEGLKADVVTFNQVNDVQLLADNKFVAKDWAARFPHGSSPYFSVHSILVRKGNPKGIKDWADLAKAGVTIVQVNPKTGGNGRYAVLAYYAAGLQAFNNDAAQARALTKKILANVVVFESGGRTATSTFTEREIGDVLVTFEAETLALASAPGSAYQVITPSVSVLAEFPVAVVEKVAAKRGTAAVAKAYLDFLYTPQGQEIVAKNHYRPRDAGVAARYAAKLTPVKTVEVDAFFGGWEKVTKQFFDNGALVDTLLKEVAAERIN